MATQLSENTLATLKVLRQSDQGSFLDGGTGNTNDDILLHKDQQTAPVKIGDEVPVFLYKDPKGRLTASMRLPAIKEGQIGYVEVINKTQFGVFVEVGTERGIFMPHAEMRGRPQLGEKVWVRLYTDKSGRLAAIYNFTSDGAFFITPERWIAFIHNSEMTHHLKVGELIDARVTYKRDDGRVNVSMRPVKETALTIDGEVLLEYLYQRNGRMPYSDKSSSDIIKAKFGFSKAAFKRAVGHLMKEGKVIQEEGWTLLTETGKTAAEELVKSKTNGDAPQSAGVTEASDTGKEAKEDTRKA